MNLLDLLLLVGFAAAAVRGYREGALSQVAAIGGLVLGVMVGAAFAPRIAAGFVDRPGTALALWTLGLLLAAVFLGQGVGLAIGWRLRRAAHRVGGAAVDRGLGTIVGIVGVVLGVWLLAGAFAQGPYPSVARQVHQSSVIGAIDDTLPQAPDVFARVGRYLDRHGFPQVFSDLGAGTAAPIEPPGNAAVAAAQEAGAPATVQVQSLGCGGVSSGSGFVAEPGVVVTNAHVVAGGDTVLVRDRGGEREATVIGYDPDLDVAVLSVPGTSATPIGWVDEPAQRGTAGATLGHPGGQRELAVGPARVRDRTGAVGRDIYGNDQVRREILILTAQIRSGNSGGPFVTSDGLVGGVVFAASRDDGNVGYALTAEAVRPVVDAAVDRSAPAATGSCRY